MLGPQLRPQRPDHPHRCGLLLRRIPTRRRLPRCLLFRHNPILVSKVRSLQQTQGASLFSPDSVMTVATFRALKTLGISIPDEVSLMWFDNLEWTRLVSPELSVVSQPVLGMKQSAATELLRRIDGDEDEFRTTFCDTEFVYRASTAPPPSG
ncbi:substrate-binding domain-containing protein [Microbacterium enclense]|uniref:substrate-binding domain-containing protein n=1 Tax=Microbacterium enclense TaxID=993073 RepID=UPI003D71B7F2